MEKMINEVVGLMGDCEIGEVELDGLRFALRADAKVNGREVGGEEMVKIVGGHADACTRQKWETLDSWVFMVKYNTEHPA